MADKKRSGASVPTSHARRAPHARRANIRLAIMLGLLALGFYVSLFLVTAR